MNVTITGASKNMGAGCLMLFSLPFILFGLGAMVGGAVQLVQGSLEGGLGLLGFGVVFAGVGTGVLLLGRAAGRHLRALQAAREQAPDAPWLWRPDWAAGRVADSNRGGMIAAIAFALFWNAVSWPVTVALLPELLARREWMVLVLLIFPLVGIGLAAWALHAALRYRKYGTSILELDTLPAPIGGRLAATLRAPVDSDPTGGFRAVLSCLRVRVTGSGDDRRTSETILWQEEQTIRSVERRIDWAGASLPIAFAIPRDALPSDDSDSSNRVVWRVAVSAEVPGVDYGSTFEVPVFPVAGTTAVEETAAVEAEPDARRDPGSPILVTTNRRGTEIVFPPARNPGPAVFLTFFFLLWSGVTWFLTRVDAGLLFVVVFGFFDALLLVGLLLLWLQRTTVVAGPDHLRVRHSILGLGRNREFRSADVEDITLPIGMQSGSTPYYDIQVRLRDGGKVKAGGAIRDKREARWLVERVWEGLGRTR